MSERARDSGSGEATDGGSAVDREFMNALATDALSVFRTGLLLVSLYATILALVFRAESVGFVTRIGNSLYTIFGIQLILGSMIAGVLLYIRIRAKATHETYPDSGLFSDERLLSYGLGASAFGLVLAVICLLAGILEGFSGVGVPAIQVSAFFFPVILIIIIFDLLMVPALLLRAKDWVDDYREAHRATQRTDPDGEIED